MKLVYRRGKTRRNEQFFLALPATAPCSFFFSFFSPTRGRSVVEDVLSAITHVHISGMMHEAVLANIGRCVYHQNGHVANNGSCSLFLVVLSAVDELEQKVRVHGGRMRGSARLGWAVQYCSVTFACFLLLLLYCSQTCAPPCRHSAANRRKYLFLWI